MKLTPIHDRIIFEFAEEVIDGKFSQSTKSGITIVENKEKQVNKARWGKVLSVGEDVDPTEIVIGDYILIEPLMWTNKVRYDGKYYWKTAFDKILAVSKDLPTE